MAKYLTQIVADGELAAALYGFNEVCAAHAAELSLSPADLAEIAEAADGFQADLNAWVAAKNAADAVLLTKDTRKEASRETVAKWARIFRANPAISDSLLAGLQLAPHRTPGTRSTPSTPQSLVASADGQGNVLLKWDRNGNHARTVFQVQVRRSPNEPWTMLESTTRTRLRLAFKVGEYIAFRVLAKRGTRSSTPSTTASLWSEGLPVQAKLAA